MTFRSDLREKPPAFGPDWPNNGEAYERIRVGLLEEAELAEAAGDADMAAVLRARSVVQRRERDRCYRDHERRVLNRRIKQGRF